MVGNRSGQVVGIRVFAGVNGTYDNGLVPISVDQNGQIANPGGLYGVEGYLGVYGTKRYGRSSLGIDYRGSYRWYNSSQYFNGTEQAFSLGYVRQMNARWVIDLRQVAGTTSFGAGNFLGGTPLPPTLIGGSSLIFFDNRTNYVQSSASTYYRQNARWTWNLNGSGFWLRRQSNSLFGMNGWFAGGSLSYAYSRRTSVALGYTFSRYEYPRAFGQTEFHSLQLGIQHRFNRIWAINLSGGVMRLDSKGLTTVALDPAIAAILGTSEVIQAFSASNAAPRYGATVNGTFRTFNVSFGYDRGAFPGNGLFLTTINDTFSGSYSYTGIRRWNFGASFNGFKARSYGATYEPIFTYGAGGGVTYAMSSQWHFSGRYDWRHVNSEATNFIRNSSRITVGVVWSPGDLPLSLW
jgi:hypothetical protein